MTAASGVPSLRLAGPPQARAAAGDRWHALERKDAALLALLALEGAMPRDALSALLWPDVPRRTANVSLRQRIFRLRRRLGHELVEAGERVALLPGVEVDVRPLAAKDAPDGAALTESARSHELLAGLTYDDAADLAAWVEQQRARHLTRVLDALAAAASRHEAGGELARAISATQALLALQPLAEHAQRRLMRLHYLRGDRAAAIDCFERFERLLKDELGTRPDTETLALLRTVEGSAAAPELGARPRTVPASVLRPPRLVGRQAELLAMRQAWAAGRVFLLLGEAGMGKTRLLQTLCQALSQGPARAAACEPARAVSDLHPAQDLVLLVAARPGDAGVPFALLARWLRALRERNTAVPDPAALAELSRVLPELGSAPTGGEGQRLLLQRAVEGQLEAAAQQGLSRLLLDDLHFADAASLEMLQALLGSERLASLSWGLAQREGEGEAAAQALRTSLEESQRLQSVPLSPLSAAEITELLASLGIEGLDAAALAPALARHTGGNPLFALETLKDLVLAAPADAVTAGLAKGPAAPRLPQPASVGALIERRLRTLSATALALARVAALAGVDFDVQLAQAVLHTPAIALADAWAELERAHVLAGGVFAHDLVFDAVRRSVPADIARHVHGELAAVLQARGGEPARMAEHWRQAGRWPEAGEAFERAAQQARRAGRVQEAWALGREAVSAWQQAGDRHRSQHCEVQSLELQAMLQGVAAAAAAAGRLVASAVGGAERCAALTAAAMVHNLAGRWAQALALAEQALQAATAEGSLAETAAAAGAIDTLDAERARGLALSQLGRPAEAVDTLRGALARAGTCAPARRRIELQAALAYALNMLNRLGECSEVLQRTITLAAQEGDLLEVMSNRQNLAALQAARGRAADGLAHARAAQQLRDQLGDAAGPHGPMNQMAMGSFCIQLGRYGEALALLEAVLPVMQQQLPFAVPAVHNFLAQLWLLLGQWGRARALLEPAADPDPNGQHGLRRAVLRARLQRWQALQLARGVALPGESADESAVEPTEGHAALATELQQALQAAPPGVDERQQLVARLELSRVQPGGEALALVRQVQQRAAELQADGIVLHARQLELQHLLPLDPDHALRLARELARAPEDVVPTDGYLPELWWLLACCAAREGRPAQQAHWLQQARRWIEAAAAGLPAGLRSRFLQGHPMQARVLAARSAA